MPPLLVTFRAGDRLDTELAARADTMGATARRDLLRYYAQLAVAEREERLSEPELNYLRDILNGTWTEDLDPRLISHEVENAEPAFAERWGIDAKGLVIRLREMPSFALMAILDRIERLAREGVGAGA